MHRSTIKLWMNIFFMFATLVGFGIVSILTYNYVDGTLKVTHPDVTGTIEVRYGLFEYCDLKRDNNTPEDCTGIEYDKMADFTKPGGYFPTSGQPQLEMIFIFVFYGIGVLTLPVFFLPFCIRIKEKNLLYAAGVFVASGIGCIIFGCLFTKSIIGFWEDNRNEKLEVSLERSYSFYLHIVLSSLMIVAGLGSILLVKGYDENRYSRPSNVI